MKILYITLNNEKEARAISKKLLENKLANCTNWFPITCMYNWEGEVKEEAEVVLLVKTKNGYFTDIEKLVKKEINYTNCIAQIDIEKNNKDFREWIRSIVK